jgi:hypothetical protein
MHPPVPLRTICIAAELWDMDVPSTRIGEMLGGLSRSTITGMARRRRDLFRPKQPGIQRGTSFWTKGRIADAVRLWSEGQTAHQLAAHFGRDLTVIYAMITRNREQFPRKEAGPKVGTKHTKPRKAKEPKVAKAPRERKDRPAPKVRAPKPVAQPKPVPVAVIAPVLPPKADSWKPLPDTNPAGLMRLCGCRWPVECEDDRFVKAATYFCNEPRTWKTSKYGKAKLSSYCATHDAMSVGVGTLSERAAEGALVGAA